MVSPIDANVHCLKCGVQGVGNCDCWNWGSASCEICGGTKKQGKMKVPGYTNGGKKLPVIFRVCETCHKNEPKFRTWLAAHLRTAMESDPRCRRLVNAYRREHDMQ